MPSGSIARSRRPPFLQCVPARALVAAFLALTCSLGVMSPAAATAEAPSEEVRALFDEGVSLVDRRRWAEAEDRFRRCLAIRRSPVIEYNLASALDAQGELAEAASLLHGILEQPSSPAALRRASAARLARIEPRLAHVTVVLTGARSDAVVSIDGRPIPLERVGAPIALDPGRHEFAARDRRSEAVVALEADEGDSLEVELALRVPTPREAAAMAGPGEPMASDRPAAYRRPWVWVAVSTAVVGVIIATAFLAQDGGDGPNVRTARPGIVIAEME